MHFTWTLRRCRIYSTKALCSNFGSRHLQRIKYRCLHLPDEETTTFETDVIKNHQEFKSFPSLQAQETPFLLLCTGACQYHCTLPKEVINMNRTWIYTLASLPVHISLQNVFHKPGNASYEKTNTSDFKPVGFFSKFLSHLSFTLQNEDLKIL